MLRYIAYEELTYNTLKSLLQMAIDLKGNIMAIWGYCVDNSVGSTSTLSAVKVPQALDRQRICDKQKLERVTVYGDDDLYSLQDAYAIERTFINGIVDSVISINSELDSISIYKESEKEWLMCIIFHENMCIIKNIINSEEAVLKKYGFNYSNSPPENW